MQCPNCGTANPEGAKFCRGCGRALSPAALPATPAPSPAITARPHPTPISGRLGQFLDPVDLLLALTGTGLGALASYLSHAFLPQASMRVPAFALTLAIAVLALLAAFFPMLFIAYRVFEARSNQRRMKLKNIIQKEKAFFMNIEGDLTVLLSEQGRPNAD